MNESIVYLGLVFGVILTLALGNLLLGKKKNGGKRFVVCIAGSLLTLLGAMTIFLAYKAGDWSEGFTWCLSAGGLASLSMGAWLMILSVKAKNEKIEKVFDSILGGA